MTKLPSNTVSIKPLGPKKPGQVSYGWTRKMTLSIPIFCNEINAL
jgi:hypothetical protein